MKTIVLNQPGELISVDKPLPKQVPEGHVLLKVRRLAICGTDLHAFKGRQPFFSYPRILGHEIAAEVVEIGALVSGFKVGDICSIEPYRNDLLDQAVKRGKITCGSQLKVLGVHEDGGMQEFIAYQADKLHKVNGLTLDEVALVEPLAIGSHAVERAQIIPEDIVLVVGAGPIGIAVVTMARFKGCKVIVADIDQNRLNFVKEKYPEVVCVLSDEQVKRQLNEILDGNLPTILIDATGNSASMHNSFDIVAAGGTIVFVGLFQGEVHFNDPNFHRKELTLKASRAAEPSDFKKVIKFMEGGLIDVKGFVTHRIPFNKVTEAFIDLYKPENNLIKAIIDF